MGVEDPMRKRELRVPTPLSLIDEHSGQLHVRVVVELFLESLLDAVCLTGDAVEEHARLLLTVDHALFGYVAGPPTSGFVLAGVGRRHDLKRK